MRPQMDDEFIIIEGPSNSNGNQNFNYFSPAIKQIITQDDFPNEMYNSHGPVKHNNNQDLVMKISKCKTSPAK